MSVSDDDWQAALALMEALLERPPGEREAALAASGATPAVQARVRRMLSAAAGGSVLDAPIAVGARRADHAEGARLGRWMLLEPIGRGGMSTVWRARSVVAPVAQEAALKVMDAGAIDEAALRRFDRELAVLSRLSHPGVAALLEAGRADDGVPWFAMGLIDGQPIDAWCDARRADRDLRVGLLVQACGAVAHAHRHLVVHRDIKPGNVLVDRDGRVVLVDFGISRLLEETREQSTGTYAFTPRFAAPEQRSGGAISTATDLWGLGALAHWLLAGDAPVLAEGADAVTPPATLPTDLRAILARCLQRDPAERYRSADALADDLQAFLDGRPVAARRGGWAYRAGRWLRRRPGGAALSAALVLSVGAGVAASVLQSRRAEAEAERAVAAQRVAEEARRAAETEAARALAQRRFTLSLFEASIPGRAPDELPDTRELVEQGIARARDPASGSAALRADMLLTLAEIVSARLQFAEAEALVDEAAALLGGPDAAPREAWARVLLQRADLPRRQRKDTETARALEEGIAWLEAHHPDALELLEMQRDAARLAISREDFARAEQRLLALRARLEGRRDTGTLPMRVEGDIAVLYGLQGRAAEALAAHEAVLALKQADPSTSSASFATTLFNVGSAAWMLGDAGRASAHFDEALARLASIDEPMQQRAAIFAAQARMAHASGDVDRALRQVRASAEEWARALGLSGPDEDFFEAYHRGRILADIGHADADAMLSEAIVRMRRREDAPPHRIGEVQARRAALACERGDAAAGEVRLAEARVEATIAPPWALAEAGAQCALHSGRAGEAVALLASVERRGTAQASDPDFDLMRYETLQAEALLAAGETARARAGAAEVAKRLRAIQASDTHVLLRRAEAVLRATAALEPRRVG